MAQLVLNGFENTYHRPVGLRYLLGNEILLNLYVVVLCQEGLSLFRVSLVLFYRPLAQLNIYIYMELHFYFGMFNHSFGLRAAKLPPRQNAH